MVMVGGHGGMAPSATQASAAAGLPFAGVPSELQEGASRLLAREPEHPSPNIDFDPIADSSSDGTVRRFGLRDMLVPHRRAVIGGLALLCTETAAMLTGPVLVQQGIDHGILAGNPSMLNRVVLVYLGIVAASIVLSRVRQRHNGRIAEQMMYDLRLRLFSHYQRLSLDWYTSAKSGVLLSRMTSDMEYVGMLVNEGFVNLIIQALTVAVVTAVLFVYNPLLAVVLLVGIVPPLAALTLWFRARSEAGYGEVRDRIADLLADLSENLAGIRVIAALNRRKMNVARHRHVTARYRDANLEMAKASAIYGPSTEAIGIAAQGLVLAVGGAMVLRGGLAVGELAAFVLFVTTFFAPIQQLVQLYSTYQQGQSGLAKIGQILALHPSVAERPDAFELPPTEGHIRLEGVSFSYDDADPETDSSPNGESVGIRLTADPMAPVASLPALSSTAPPAVGRNPSHNGSADEAEDRPEVLRDVSLDIRPGETFALVGPTGAGKSTIAKLITRFYDPTAGRVTIDGWDLRDVTFASLRNQLGIASGTFPVSRDHPRQRGVRAASSQRRRGSRRTARCGHRRCARSGWAAQAHRQSSRRRRHPCPRARRVAVGRRAAAAGAGSRIRGPSTRHRARRGHLERRSEHRGRDRGRFGPAAGGPHGCAHRPPACHCDARRPNRGDRRRRSGGARQS